MVKTSAASATDSQSRVWKLPFKGDAKVKKYISRNKKIKIVAQNLGAFALHFSIFYTFMTFQFPAIGPLSKKSKGPHHRTDL
ncbi:hypothetical protein DCC81_11415 [Chitinophaga parva]|uniref:Uncharacterized protein n=1 Tax=Chitinophaga parva TaxID=2169414 RepID=A0A2T7BF63_9BACT|nr:hypothetical protein DCC81_11415 [Chitinophaga parva]